MAGVSNAGWLELPLGNNNHRSSRDYGAALNDVQFPSRASKLRLTVRTGMVVVPSDDKRMFMQTEITNYGDRPTTLRTIDLRYFEKPWSWARLRNRATKAAVLNNPNPGQPLPCELKPGGVWTGLTAQEPELVEWGTKGVLYCDLYHSASHQAGGKRVRFQPERKQ